MNTRMILFALTSCYLIGCGGGGANNASSENSASSSEVTSANEQTSDPVVELELAEPELMTSELVASADLAFNSDYYLELSVDAPAGHTVLVYQYTGATPTTEQRLFMATTDGTQLTADLRLGPQLEQLLLQLISSDPDVDPIEKVLDLPLSEYHWQP